MPTREVCEAAREFNVPLLVDLAGKRSDITLLDYCVPEAIAQLVDARLLTSEGPISGLAFSHDSRHLATASADRTVRLWNTSSLAAEPLMLRTPDGATELRMWDIRAVDSPEPPRVLGDKLGPGSGSVFSPDGQWIATIRAGGVDFVDLWKLSTPSPSHYRVHHPGGIWAKLDRSRMGAVFRGSALSENLSSIAMTKSCCLNSTHGGVKNERFVSARV